MQRVYPGESTAPLLCTEKLSCCLLNHMNGTSSQILLYHTDDYYLYISPLSRRLLIIALNGGRVQCVPRSNTLPSLPVKSIQSLRHSGPPSLRCSRGQVSTLRASPLCCYSNSLVWGLGFRLPKTYSNPPAAARRQLIAAYFALFPTVTVHGPHRHDTHHCWFLI